MRADKKQTNKQGLEEQKKNKDRQRCRVLVSAVCFPFASQVAARRERRIDAGRLAKQEQTKRH